MEYGQKEHIAYIGDSYDEHVEEEDYKEDAPVGIDQTYALQLKNMEFAKTKNQNNKWGEIAYEDTAEAVQAKMHKFSDPAKYVYDMPVDY